jgi:hypothetical protein
LDSPKGFQVWKQKIRDSAVKILGLDESRITTALDKKERQYDEERGWYITYISYFSEKYMKIRCSLYEKKPGASNSIMIHVGDLPGDDWIERSLERFSVVFCLEPRGRGQNRLEPGAWFYTGDEIQNEEASYNCNADMLGRSVLGMMVHDVLSLQKMISEQYGKDVELAIYGREEDAITALFAALIGDIRNVELSHLLYSYKCFIDNKTHTWNPSIFVNALLANLDISDLLRALSPAKVSELFQPDIIITDIIRCFIMLISCQRM